MPATSDVPADLLRFLQAVDANARVERPVEIFVGGAAGILLAYGGNTATADVDFIGEKTGLLAHLAELAGRGSEIHASTGYFVDIVPPGLFPQEWGWRARATRVRIPDLVNIELCVLEQHDLVLSKLRRFSGKDQEDIRLLCNRRDFEIAILRERYGQARQLYDYDEREDLDLNFNFVEREFLRLAPTVFD